MFQYSVFKVRGEVVSHSSWSQSLLRGARLLSGVTSYFGRFCLSTILLTSEPGRFTFLYLYRRLNESFKPDISDERGERVGNVRLNCASMN